MFCSSIHILTLQISIEATPLPYNYSYMLSRSALPTKLINSLPETKPAASYSPEKSWCTRGGFNFTSWRFEWMKCSSLPCVFCSLFCQMSLKTTWNLFHAQLRSTRLKYPEHHFVCSHVVISAIYIEYLTKLNSSNLKSIVLVKRKKHCEMLSALRTKADVTLHVYRKGILWR